jgi:diadenosine tetraphosphate (Ap4A) HIT family hydrolase
MANEKDGKNKMQTDIELAVDLAKAGTNPTFITQLDSGWVFLGLNQVLAGTCFLVADPYIATIDDMDEGRRNAFMSDMLLVGKAVMAVTGAERMNYLFLGNKDPVLHVHIIPRFGDENEEYKQHGPWKYEEYTKFDIDRDTPLIEKIRAELKKLTTVTH